MTVRFGGAVVNSVWWQDAMVEVLRAKGALRMTPLFFEEWIIRATERRGRRGCGKEGFIAKGAMENVSSLRALRSE